MCRRLIFIFFVFCLSLACDFFSSMPTVTPAASTLTPVPRLPTVTPFPTFTVVPSVQKPTDNSPVYFTERFDSNIDDWSYFLGSGEEKDTKVYIENGKLTVEINNLETYVYLAYKNHDYSDVRIDTVAENTGENNTNNVGIFCRYSEKGWYEFNVTSNGYYFIYYVDKSGGKLVYNRLAKGASQSIKTGKASNLYSAICDGDMLKLIINHKEIKPVVDTNLKEGQTGVSVSTVNAFPVMVSFDWITIAEP